MSQVGFEPTISADKEQRIYALDRAATRIGELAFLIFANIKDVASMFAATSMPLLF